MSTPAAALTSARLASPSTYKDMHGQGAGELGKEGRESAGTL